MILSSLPRSPLTKRLSLMKLFHKKLRTMIITNGPPKLDQALREKKTYCLGFGMLLLFGRVLELSQSLPPFRMKCFLFFISLHCQLRFISNVDRVGLCLILVQCSRLFAYKCPCQPQLIYLSQRTKDK